MDYCEIQRLFALAQSALVIHAKQQGSPCRNCEGDDLKSRSTGDQEPGLTARHLRFGFTKLDSQKKATVITCVFLDIGAGRFTNYIRKSTIQRSLVIMVKNVVNETIPAVATLSHFPAVLCGWACAALIKRDELRRQFGAQIRIGYDFLHLLGAVSERIDAGWGNRGGAAERERFPAVKQAGAKTEPCLHAAARAGSARHEAR